MGKQVKESEVVQGAQRRLGQLEEHRAAAMDKARPHLQYAGEIITPAAQKLAQKSREVVAQGIEKAKVKYNEQYGSNGKPATEAVNKEEKTEDAAPDEVKKD